MGGLIFISYRRQRGYELAHLVNAELRSRGLRTFIDVAESDPGQFWAQARAAIRRCRALVLICTNGSFESKSGDDWVLREVTEAIALNRPIVPVFSQDFKPPSVLPPALAQAIEYNGVSMDTQFHVAAFDHLSELVGGRKRSEQRRRLAVLGSLAVLTLLASLVLGAREIIGLNEEFRRERETRQAAEVALQKSRADERRATERRQLEADAQREQLARDLAAAEKRRLDQMRADEDRQRQAEKEAARRAEQAKFQAEWQARQRRWSCESACRDTLRNCESSCFFKFDGPDRDSCKASCQQNQPFCMSNCQ